MTDVQDRYDPSRVQTWRKITLPELEVEAAQLTELNAAQLTAWCGGQLVDEIDPFDSKKRQPGINVPGDLGRERASVGDYIFKIAKRDFRVSKPGAFLGVWEVK